jgi:hypothetical protein
MTNGRTPWSVSLRALQRIPDKESWAFEVEERLRLAGADSPSIATSQQLDWFDVRIWIESARSSLAIAAAEKILGQALPNATIVRAEVQTEEEFDRELATPSFPELVGPQEMATRLSVSRQRLYELMRRPDFPEPVVQLAIGPIWLAQSVNHFVEGWSRKPGRPRASATRKVAAWSPKPGAANKAAAARQAATARRRTKVPA